MLCNLPPPQQLSLPGTASLPGTRPRPCLSRAGRAPCSMSWSPFPSFPPCLFVLCHLEISMGSGLKGNDRGEGNRGLCRGRSECGELRRSRKESEGLRVSSSQHFPHSTETPRMQQKVNTLVLCIGKRNVFGEHLPCCLTRKGLQRKNEGFCLDQHLPFPSGNQLPVPRNLSSK